MNRRVTYVFRLPDSHKRLVSFDGEDTRHLVELAPLTSIPRTLVHWRANSPWFALAPKRVAEKQVLWERREAMLRMRDLGYTLGEIATYCGVSRPEIGNSMRRQLLEKNRLSPITKWLREKRDLRTLASARNR